MKKNFLFAALTVLLAGFWFGGASLAQEVGGGGGGGGGGKAKSPVDLNCGTFDAVDVTYDTEGKVIATIGKNCYSSLRTAIADADDGDEINLIADDDVTFSNSLTLTIDKEVIINGGNHKLLGKNFLDAYPSSILDGGHAIIIEGGSDIEIKKLIISDFGGEYYVSKGIVPIYVDENYDGTLKLDNLTIKNYNRTAITIKGGEVYITNSMIIGNPLSNYKPNEVACKNDGVDVKCEQMQQGIDITNAWVIITDTDISGISYNRATGEYDAYGILVRDGSYVYIQSSTITTNTGDYSAGIITMGDSELELFSNTITVNGDETVNGGAGEAVFEAYGNSRIFVSNNTESSNSNTYQGAILKGDNAWISIGCGIFTFNPTNFLAMGRSMTENDGLYTVIYDPVATVNGRGHSSLADAVADANDGETIKLNKDINTGISINKEDITLDLNGHSIISSDSDAISNYGTLTILNGTVKTTAKNKGAIVNYPGGEITIGDINKKEETLVNVSSENNEYARYAIKNMGTMIVNSAYITKASSSASIIANGWYGNAGNDRNVAYPNNCSSTANLTFNGGTVEGPAGESLNVIKNDDCGVLIINDGTFTSNTDLSVDTVAPVIQNWHIATVNSGIFQSLKGVAITNGYLGIEDKGEIEVNGGTFIPTQSLLGLNGGATKGGKVVLKNGIFGGIISKPENKYDVQIQGGIFENKPDINYILDSYSVYKNNDGKYVVTTTAAAEQGAAEANVTPDPIVAAETTFTTGATENFSAEIPAEDSSKAGVVEQKLPDVAGDNATYTLIVDTKEEIQKVAESGDTTTTMTGVKESELRSSTNKVLEIKGGAEVYIKRADGTSTGRNTESVEFTEPVAIPIFVGTELSGQSVFVQSKHATGEAFGITGLVKDGTSCSSSNAVTSAPSIPVGANGYAIAYTCKASTFVAYTEVDNSTPSGSSSGSSGGGGGGSSSYSCKNLPANAVANNTSKPKKNTDYSYSTDTSAVCTFQCKSGYTRNEKDAKCEKSDTEATTGDTAKLDETKTDENKADNNEGNKNATAVNGYSQEFIDAYEFAFKNGITTMPSIQEADMEGTLTRIAMAKMLSQYAINVLGKKPANIVVPNFPDVSAELDEQYNNGVALAYQLGIMGINIENFRPNDLVTRAEFGTALSRLLYGTADGEGAYYETHLQKLMDEKIITNDNPDLQELRGYVMIMLMRSANK